MGELWAGGNGMRCDYPACERRTYTVYLTEAENASLPAESGPEAASFIFEKQLGKTLCEKHAKKLFAS
jgi:hypothetical protein